MLQETLRCTGSALSLIVEALAILLPDLDMSRISPSSAKKKACKNISVTNFVSHNVRGLKSDTRIEELYHSIKSQNFFAACLQETWRTGSHTLEYENNLLLLSGLDPNSVTNNRGSQGVGIALSADAVTAWRAAGSVVHNDLGARVMAVRLLTKDSSDKDMYIFLVSAYAPIGSSNQLHWDDFFDCIDICLSRMHHNDTLLIGCDTNSSMGTRTSPRESAVGNMCSVGCHGISHVNESGRRFLSYLELNNLVTLTTYFQKKNYGTWMHPRSKNLHQIDHFLTRKTDFHRFKDAGVTSPLLDSDHRAIQCRLKVVCFLKKEVTPRSKMLHLDHSKLQQDDEQLAFCKNVINELKSTDTESENRSLYTQLASAAISTAKKTLPKKPKANPGWFETAKSTLLPLIERRNLILASLYARSHARRTRADTQRLRKVRKDLKREVARAKNNWIADKCQRLNESSSGKGGTKESWKLVDQLKRGLSKVKTSAEQRMRKEDGTMSSSPEENAEVFSHHFDQLYNRSASFDNTVLDSLEQSPVAQNCTHAPLDDEILSAIKRLKNAPGDSGICPQIWKALAKSEETFNILRTIIHHFWESELPPSEWDVGLLKILPKKGDLSLASNYRGIMMLETAYKIISAIMHSRLLPIEESIDPESQCGFRPQRGCTDALYTVKMAMKKRREHGLESWILFIDLVKAFDRVPRELLWNILRKFGVPEKLVCLLEALHHNVEVKFSVCGITRTIICTIGVKQGDILGPILFLFYIAAIILTWRKLHERPLCIFRSKPDYRLTGRKPNTRGLEFPVEDSEYADDTAILFPSRKSLEECLPKLITHFQRFGAEIHVGRGEGPSKSEILFVAKARILYTEPDTFDGTDLTKVVLPDGSYMPVVELFKYLGSILSRDCRDDLDVEARIEAASAAFGALRQCLFSSANICLDAKKIVYIGLILSILLYGSETWCLTEKLYNRLRCFHARCVRSMCRVNLLHTRRHRISTADLLDRMDMNEIDSYITRRQLRWAGHVARMEFERLPRKMLSSWVANRRPRGAPEFTYGRGLIKSLKRVELNSGNWAVRALDRECWQAILATT